MRKATTYTKETAFKHWATLQPAKNLLRHMVPIKNKATGSTYGACGIRIDGTPEFIDDVLSRLTDLLDGENGTTRLGLSRRAVESVEIAGTRKDFENSTLQSEVCYIRLHERGPEAQMARAFVAGMSVQVERLAI